MIRFRHVIGVLSVVALAGTIASAQAPAPAGGGQRGGGTSPPEPTNLQVLPKTTTTAQILPIMRNFSAALGTNCGYCHVWTAPGAPTNDYAADTKPTKLVARVMMQVANEANEKIAAGIKSKPASEITRVQCMTCHRGAAIPVLPPPPAPAGAAPGAPAPGGAPAPPPAGR
jgi:cytochrome c5